MISNNDDKLERWDEPENSPFSEEEARQAEAFDASLGLRLPETNDFETNDFETRHGKLASVFRLLHVTLGTTQIPAAPVVHPNLPQRFRIVKTIGHGGFGRVYHAYDELLQRDVAIKVVPKRTVRKAACQDTELEEPRAVARLSHPNIVPLYEVLSDGETLCLISEFSSGPTLNAWLRELPGPVSPNLAAEITWQLAEAVAHAHSRGIVHRDIKPANVLLSPIEDRNSPLDFSPKLTDFGLVRDLRDPELRSATHEIAGTLEYIAPEQIGGGDRAGEATCDVYSLGVLLYRMLTGRLPHSGASAMELMNRICTETPPRVRSIVPQVSRDLESICVKCLSRRPSERYPTARGLADDLWLWKSGRSVLARPRPVWEQCTDVVRNSPLVASMVALMICLVTVTTITLARSNGKLVVQQGQLQTALVESRQSERYARQAEQQASLATQEALQRRLEADINRRLAIMSAYQADLPRGFDAVQRGQFAEARKIAQEIQRYTADILPLATDFGILHALAETTPTVQGHQGEVSDVLILPQHDIFVTAAQDGILRFHELHTGETIHEKSIGTANSAIYALACTADGKRLAIGYATKLIESADESLNGVIVVDWEDWEEIQSYSGYPSTVESLAFSPDGERLAVGCRYQPVLLQSLHTRDDVVVLESDRRNREILFSPDGKDVVLFNESHQLRRFDAHSGKILQSVHCRAEPDHLAWSPDGCWIALSYFHLPELELLKADDLVTSKCLLTQPFGGTHCLAFSNNGTTIVAGLRNGGVVSWDLEKLLQNSSSQEVQPLEIPFDAHVVPHRTGVSSIAVTPDRRVLSGSADGTVAISDLTSRSLVPKELQGISVRTARLATDGQRVFLGCANGSLIVMNLEQSTLEYFFVERKVAITKLAVSPENEHLAVGWENGDVALLELPTCDVLREQVVSETPDKTRRSVVDLRMDATGRRLAILHHPDLIEMWNWSDSSQASAGDSRLTRVETFARQVAVRRGQVLDFGSSPEEVIYGGLSEEVRIANLVEQSERILWTGRPRMTALLRNDAHNVLYCGSAEGKIELRSQTGALLAECAHVLDPFDSKSNSVDVTTLALSPDGHNLISGTIEGEIRIWNATDLRFLGVLHARDGRGAIATIDFSGDGKRLLMHQALHQEANDCGTMIVTLR